MKCMVCALSFDTFEMFCAHMTSVHNELEQKEEKELNKHNCIMCDTDFISIEELHAHYSEKHIYCQHCNELLTDEDALQKHNIQEHISMPNASWSDNDKDAIKEEPADSLISIKEEPLGCGDCGICATCNI